MLNCKNRWKVKLHLVTRFLLIIGLGLSTKAASRVDDYYSAIDRTIPNSLERQLHELVKKQHYISYKNIWRFLEVAHQANSSSVILFYTRRVVPKSDKASGSEQANNNFWNREHVWPQSKGLKGNEARRDLHNIVPADRSVNSSRGNKYFDNGGKPHSECEGCLFDNDSWEPPDEVKGDIARIVFYMDLRYNGDDSTGAPDLVASDNTSSDKRYFSGLSTLLRWHCRDSVDDTERTRNDVVQHYQGNRNPFVDRPAWVKQVFGFDC